MLTEDYIMRMINQALAVLIAALGFKRAGQFSEAQQSFDQALETLLGLNAHLANQLDDHLLLDMLTFLGKLDIDRVLVLADIYREKAEVYTSQGQHENSQFAAQRSLRLYLEAALASEDRPNVELIHKIELVRLMIAASNMPIETRLAMLDYIERLLASGDDFLASAGLSRPDLLAAFSSLDDQDLH